MASLFFGLCCSGAGNTSYHSLPKYQKMEIAKAEGD